MFRLFKKSETEKDIAERILGLTKDEIVIFVNKFIGNCNNNFTYCIIACYFQIIYKWKYFIRVYLKKSAIHIGYVTM